MIKVSYVLNLCFKFKSLLSEFGFDGNIKILHEKSNALYFLHEFKLSHNFFHDNACLHVARMILWKVTGSGYETLSRPPYSHPPITLYLDMDTF